MLEIQGIYILLYLCKKKEHRLNNIFPLPDQLKNLVNEFSQDEKEDEIKKDDDFKNDVEEVKNEDFKENDEERKDVESMCIFNFSNESIYMLRLNSNKKYNIFEIAHI